jgi:hypothetical protein
MPGQFDGIRGMAQEYISALIKEGQTNAQIVGILQDQGLSYRTSNMYNDVNRIRLEQFAAQGIKGLDLYTPVPINLMREWQGDTSFRYRVVVQYSYSPGAGLDDINAATTLYYNEQPTINDVLDDWNTRVKTLEGGYGSTTNIQRINEIREIDYFVNRPKQ